MTKVTKLLIAVACLLSIANTAFAATRQPVFMSMPAGTHFNVQEALSWYTQTNYLPKGLSFRLLNKNNDELGYTHYRYVETYNGLDIHSTMWLVHAKDGLVESMSGMVVDKLPSASNAAIKEADGLKSALNFTNAKLYKWEVPVEEQFIKYLTNNPAATYYPKAVMMWVSPDINNDQVPFKLCYAFDIYAQEPLSRRFVFVDAQNGKIVWRLDRICTASTGKVKDTAKTVYSGLRIIGAYAITSTYHVLDDSSRGAHIKTLNMKTGTTYGSAVDFTNTGTFWNDSNSTFDQYATDAHWATEMTYDFYKTTFNRHSVDDSNHALYSYVHYSTSYNNAFWDGNEMTYGDGSSQPLTALDVTGHEISHGVTQYTAALNYINESGALNEGFSDCMGKSVEHFARPSKFSWLISDDLSTAFRDMQHPNYYAQPNTYKGKDWFSGSGDNGGVHYNSGVLNFWFYLLSVGGKGTNDNSNAYVVHRIGLDTVKRILYRAQSVYNVPSTQYKDARVNTIRAAGDLYGVCSKIFKEVTNAWYAVGVGDSFLNKVVSVPFTSRTNYCSLPVVALFSSNNCINASTFKWYFGDGDSSTLSNPVHSYKRPGNFTLRLMADGGKCGKADTSIKNYISISLSAAPSATSDTLCGSGKGKLTVAGAGSYFYAWYDSAYGGTLIDTGVVFNTPIVTKTTSFYAEQGQRSHFLHPVDTTFGTGSMYSAGSTHGLVFNAISSFKLKSALVFADVSGTREIDLLDSSGNVISSVTATVPVGGSRIALNLYVPKGNNYLLTLNGGGTTNLYRSRTGASYPYTLPGVVSITGNDLGSGFSGYYYFFYNWEVQSSDCHSMRGPGVVVLPTGSLTASISASSPTTFCTGDSVTLTASNGSTYAWSTGDTARSITVNKSNIIYVAVKKGSCTVYSANDTVNVLPLPVVSISPSGAIEFCTGQSKTLKAISIGARQFKWSTGDTSQSISVNTSGTYKVFTNNGYCTSITDSVNVSAISVPSPAASYVAQPTKYSIKFINKSLNGTSYFWSLAGGSGFSYSPDSFIYSYSGGYPIAGNSVTDTVLLTASNPGCSETVKIPVNAAWYGNGINEIAAGVNLQLYPNPGNEGTNLIINSASSTHLSVTLYDATGRLFDNIFNGNMAGGMKVIYINTQALSAGLYILKTSINGETAKYKRLIVSH